MIIFKLVKNTKGLTAPSVSIGPVLLLNHQGKKKELTYMYNII